MGGRLGEWPQSSTNLILHLVPLISTSFMGLKRPSVEMGGGLERAEHFVLESREEAEPGVLMPLSEWPAGSPQKAVTPPNSQPQEMVLARGRRGGVRWVLEPCGPVSC